MTRTRFARARRAGVLTSAAAVWALAAGPATAQEIGIHHTLASSGFRELDGPAGFGAYARFFPTSRLALLIGMDQLGQTVHVPVTVCDTYGPINVGCRTEDVRRRSRVRSASLLAGVRVRPAGFLELEAGAGATVNQVGGDDRTPSGRDTNLFVYHTLQVGTVLAASLRVRPSSRLPLTAELGVATRRVTMDACSPQDYEDDPYCGTLSLRQVRLGIGYAFRW